MAPVADQALDFDQSSESFEDELIWTSAASLLLLVLVANARVPFSTALRCR